MIWIFMVGLVLGEVLGVLTAWLVLIHEVEED